MPKYSVVETVTIDAPVDKVRDIVRDFKQWPPWSPWLSAEPDCRIEYSDDGKSYSWDGKVVGSGKMQLIAETPAKVDYKLFFFKPFKSQADVSFKFAKDGSKTKVSWTMDSSMPFFMFFLVKMMKAWISSDYRRGLAKLKDYAETGKVPSQNEIEGVGAGFTSTYVGLRSQCAIDDMPTDMPSKYDRLKQWLEESGAQASAAPLSIYHKFDMVGGTTEYTAAIPVQRVPPNLPPDFVVGTLDAPKTFKIKHIGAYRHLGSGWSAGMMHQRAKAFKSAKGHDPFELYVTDPANTPEAELVTEIHFPAR